MTTELPRVLTGNEVLIGIVFQNHKIRQAADKAVLPNLLFEPKEEDYPIIGVDIDVLLEVGPEICLLTLIEPAQVALAVRGDRFIQPV